MNELNQLNNKEKVNLIPFSECFKIYQTNSLSRDKLTYDVGDIKNIHYGDIHKFLPVITNVSTENLPYIKSDINTSKIKQESYCRNGDVIMADTAEDYAGVGKAIEVTGIDNQKVIGGLHTYLCRDEKHVFVDGFRGYILNSPFVHNQIMKYSAGMKVYSITKANLSKILIPCPPITEQKRIASLLSTVDKAINHANIAIEESERMKHGLIQMVQSSTNINSDWNEYLLGDLVDINPEQRYPTNENENNTITYVDIDSVENGLGKINNPKLIIFKDAPSRARRVIHKDDVIVSMVRPENLGFAYVPEYLDNQICSTGFAVLRGKGKTNPHFLLNLMFSEAILNQFRKLTVGGQYPSLTQKSIAKTVIRLPPLAEQNKISRILNQIDKEVILRKKRKSLLETLKRGMMQQLLSGDEIS